MKFSINQVIENIKKIKDLGKNHLLSSIRMKFIKVLEQLKII